jgi:hypothetical protein
MVLPIKKELSLAELRQQREQLNTQIKQQQTAERANHLETHLQKLGEVIAEERDLGLPYVPIVRVDNIIRDVVRKLGNNQTAQQINEAVGQLIQPLLSPNEDSLVFIQNTLADRSKATSDSKKDKDGNPKALRRLFKPNADGTYSVAE